MDVVALGPFFVAALPWQRQNRAWMLTVVCKATFDLEPGELRMSSRQEPINDADNHWDDDPGRSVYSPSDLVPYRKGVDVTLVGHAFAADHKPARSLEARLCVGTIDKAVEVHADRTWDGDAQITKGPSFTRMPLRYERAPGGPGTSNPVGLARKAGPLPNLHPARRRGAQGDGALVGFGPIAADWPQREARLRHHRAGWSHHAFAQRPLPDDLDPEYFNAAPIDQRLTELAPDQEIILEHLHRDHPRLVTRLPGLRPQAFASWPVPQEIAMVADALWFNTERAVCTVTWRGQLPLVSPNEPGRVLVALTGMRQKLTWDDVERLGQMLVAPAPAAAPPPPAPSVPGALPFDPSEAEPTGRETLPTMEIIDEESSETEVLTNDDFARALSEEFQAPAWLARRVPPKTSPPPPPPTASAPVAAPVAAPVTAPAPPPVAVPVPAPAPSAPASPSISPWAAAAIAPTEAPSPVSPMVVPMPEGSRPPVAVRPSQASRRDVVDLLWFDPHAVPRIRAAYPDIIDELEFEPLDPKHDLPTDDPNASRDRHDTFGVLTRARPMDGRGIGRAMFDAISEAGRFTPPVVLLNGELRLPFDELKLLEATIAAAGPLATEENKRLKDALDAATEVLKTPLLQAPASVEAMAQRLRDALQQTRKNLGVDTHVERVLLGERRFQRRVVFGDEHLRAVLSPSGEAWSIPAYLPATLIAKLPMVTRMRARVIAEAHAQQDQYESHPQALRVIALGRLVSIDGWRT
jgi:hypothetical protein